MQIFFFGKHVATAQQDMCKWKHFANLPSALFEPA